MAARKCIFILRPIKIKELPVINHSVFKGLSKTRLVKTLTSVLENV